MVTLNHLERRKWPLFCLISPNSVDLRESGTGVPGTGAPRQMGATLTSETIGQTPLSPPPTLFDVGLTETTFKSVCEVI